MTQSPESRDPTSPSRPSRGPRAIFADLLLVRHPGLLIADGLICVLAQYGVHFLTWYVDDSRRSMGVPTSVLSAAGAYLAQWFFWLGMALMAVGIARILGASIAGRRDAVSA